MHRIPIILYTVCLISSLHAASEKPVGPLSLYQQCISIIAQREIDRPETYNKHIPPAIRQDITNKQLTTYAKVCTQAFQAEEQIAPLDAETLTRATYEALPVAESMTRIQEITPNCGTLARRLARCGITPHCMPSGFVVTGGLSLAGSMCCFGLHNVIMCASCLSLSCVCGGCFLTTVLTGKKWRQIYLRTLLPDYAPQPMTMDLEINNTENLINGQ